MLNKEGDPPYVISQLQDMDSVNKAIVQAYLGMAPEEYDRKTHFFHGRYENIYIKEQRLPALQQLIARIKQVITKHLKLDDKHVKIGFWLNAMLPGQKTTRHNHNDLDEVLSGVYYLKVPEDSGQLRFYAEQTVDLEPQAGMLVFFAPSLEHEVLPNRSKELRLSIGFNVGLIQ